MKFDPYVPVLTDPCPEALQWHRSKEADAYYFWAKQVSADVQLHPTLGPQIVEMTNGSVLSIYKGLAKQELLYRLTFGKLPERFLSKPVTNPHTLYWTFSGIGGPSQLTKSFYRDKHFALHGWVDKDAYLAVIRTNHYAGYDYSFWSR